MNFQLKNVLGSVYRRGNITFSPDGNFVYSPIGNRVFCYDLVNNTSFTFPFEVRRNVCNVAISPDGNWMFLVDEEGRCALVAIRSRSVVHEMSLKSPVSALAFSPCGTRIAVALANKYLIQIWSIFGSSSMNSPVRQFNSFTLTRVISGHHDKVTSVSWSSDGRYILSSSRDLSVRISDALSKAEFNHENQDSGDLVPPSSICRLCSHRDAVISAFWTDDLSHVYSISRDGVLYVWQRIVDKQDDMDDSCSSASDDSDAVNEQNKFKYRLMDKHFIAQQASLNTVKVKSACFHKDSQLLVIGFENGVFGLWEMPSFSLIQTLSVSQHAIDSLQVSPSGEWLAIGSSKLGQLIVWEWKSETYILKQQGHSSDDIKCLAYSPDGQMVATGGVDGKVKLWSTTDGFCFATFTEHTGSITGIEFASKHGSKQGVVFTSSSDGTIRAFDTKRFRYFRTFTSPTPVQFSCLAVDPSGEIICAGSNDTFEIFVWSVQTGSLLDVFAGHEGPISSLVFSSMESSSGGSNQSYYSSNQLLVSGSWDQTARVWDLYSRGLENKCVNTLTHGSEVVALALRSDGKEVCASTSDGKISIWNLVSEDPREFHSEINAQADIDAGRTENDARTASFASKSLFFTSLCYSADGKRLIAGSTSRWICNYDLRSRCLLTKTSLSKNFSLDGMTRKLNAKIIPNRSNDDDSTRTGDKSKKTVIKCSHIRFSPSGDSWAACTSEGVLIYGRKSDMVFDPIELDMELTPESTIRLTKQTIAAKDPEWITPMVMALRLNDSKLITYVCENIHIDHIEFTISQLPVIYLSLLLNIVSMNLGRSDLNSAKVIHVEHYVTMLESILRVFWKNLKNKSNVSTKKHGASISTILKATRKDITNLREDLKSLSSENLDMISYLLAEHSEIEI